jgi:hypothetical protein
VHASVRIIFQGIGGFKLAALDDTRTPHILGSSSVFDVVVVLRTGAKSGPLFDSSVPANLVASALNSRGTPPCARAEI